MADDYTHRNKMRDWVEGQMQNMPILNKDNVMIDDNLHGIKNMFMLQQEETIIELKQALQDMLDMHDLMMKKANHANSAYDADCIKAMNEVPIRARAILIKGDT